MVTSIINLVAELACKPIINVQSAIAYHKNRSFNTVAAGKGITNCANRSFSTSQMNSGFSAHVAHIVFANFGYFG
jgi:hypothetical protein